MAGIAASAILRLIDRWEREDVNMHGFVLRRGGETIAEAYYAPFAPGQMHRMYSVSKSMTALGIALMAQEGKLTLDDPICSHFPDKLPPEPDERLLRLTIRDMLRMATCYEKTTYREGIDRDWAATFFCGRATHEPGTVFFYDTSCSQVLCALVERLSGKGMLALLEERIFAPIGASDPKRWLTDPSGVCQGGTGLLMSLRDLAKVSQLIMDGGRGLIPADFLAEATALQIDTSMQANPEERFGYGWQFWRTRNGYAMYGMGGQLAVFCPEQDVLLCTIADTRLDPFGVQRIYDGFFEEIVAHLNDRETEADRCALEARLRTLRVPALSHTGGAMARGAWAIVGDGALKRVSVDEKSVRLTWADGEDVLRWEKPGEVLAGTFRGAPCLTSAGMTPGGVLRARCHLIGDAPCGVELLLSARGERMTLRLRRSSDPLTAGYDGLFSGISDRA